jgi:hypothetical protein
MALSSCNFPLQLCADADRLSSLLLRLKRSVGGLARSLVELQLLLLTDPLWLRGIVAWRHSGGSTHRDDQTHVSI